VNQELNDKATEQIERRHYAKTVSNKERIKRTLLQRTLQVTPWMDPRSRFASLSNLEAGDQLDTTLNAGLGLSAPKVNLRSRGKVEPVLRSPGITVDYLCGDRFPFVYIELEMVEIPS